MAELNSDNYKSRLRNKLVAEAFYLTGNIEKYGSGLIRIRKAMHDYPELSLNTQEISGGFMLTFAQVKVEKPESQPEESNGTGQVTAEIARLLGVVHDEMSRQQLQDALALKSRDNFDRRYLKAAIELKLIEPTIPEKPSSRLQKYRLTQAGQSNCSSRKIKTNEFRHASC